MSRFDEEMKGTYNQARPEDLISSFDREALWARIDTRIERPLRSKRIYLRWASYAAAVAAGMLIMGLWQSGQYTESLSAGRILQKEHADEAKRPRQERVIAAAVTPIHQVPGKQDTKQKPVQPAAVAVNTVPAQVAPAIPGTEENSTAKRIEIIAKPVAMQVRHLMDIGNEDRHVIDAGPLPKLQKAAFIHLNLPGGQHEDQGQLVFRNVFKSTQD